jgi:hypothetical protein
MALVENKTAPSSAIETPDKKLFVDF